MKLSTTWHWQSVLLFKTLYTNC